MNQTVSATDILKATLRTGLAPFRAKAGNGMVPHGPQLFSYCALERERLIAIELPHPVIGIVLAGAKEVWRGEISARFTPGTAFVLPGEVPLDIWNLPSEAEGLYQSLVMEVAQVPRGLLHDAPQTLPQASAPFELALSPHLVEALIHAATAIADGPAAGAIRTSRMAELLALLSHDPAAKPLFRATLGETVARIVAADPAEPWTVGMVASRLAMAESTLRRKLSREGTSFRQILRSERLNAARALIADGSEPCLTAALAAGYRSRSHFARRYREKFGSNPSGRQHR